MSRNRDPDFFAWSDSDLDLDELPVCRSAVESYGILWKSLDRIPWSIGTNFPSDSMQSMEK
ncbi:hypothetical protein DPMN_182723 [Dreissena polymorpha]|uniref:Uncharacterized protein n=1 Tax=Dreissena polymorpha TaxID=45954 RepID=A0A9D4I4V1_DREPO|nr:hypothetical protein DPMN_182723 [Dreissena polymorpha]